MTEVPEETAEESVGQDFEVVPFKNGNVQYLYSRQAEIDMDPAYQRQSGVWSLEKQQLLIDSLINGFDVPTIYLHEYRAPVTKNGKIYRYALVDGKQRLGAIFRFLNNGFALSGTFVRLKDGKKAAAGKTYDELKTDDPLLASDLQVTSLDVKSIRTNDLELIEDMFSRLNEAVPLNAAEKRNALGGPLPPAVREIIAEHFFTVKLPFSNNRYRHMDLAAKFLYLVDGLPHTQAESPEALNVPRVPGWSARDLKKVRLDRFFKQAKADDGDATRTATNVDSCRKVLTALSGIFVDKDRLLSSVGMVTVYFLLYLERKSTHRPFPGRTALEEFESARRVSPNVEEDHLSNSDLAYVEFARLSQSPNDGSALAFRLAILDTWLNAKEHGEDANAAVGALYADDRWSFE